MVALDAKTMFVALVAVHIILGLAMIVGLRRQRERELGLMRWGYAMFTGGVGLILLAFRGIWPDFLTITVGNTLVSMELVFFYLSICAYYGHRQSRFWTYAPPILSAIWMTLAHDQTERNIAAGVLLGTQFVPIGLIVWRNGFATQTALRGMLFGGVVLVATQYWLRAVFNMWTHHGLPIKQTNTATDSITLLTSLCVVLVFMGAVWLLHWDRSEAELRQQRDKARRVSADKSRFVASASHDLRSPIQAISLYLQALGVEKLTVGQRALHTKLTIVTDELGSLVNSLLNVAQLDAGGVVPKKRLVSLDDLFTRMDEEFAPSAIQKGLRWKLHWPAKAPMLYTDGSLLLTLLRNLVANAIKYTPHGGVLVTARIRDRRILMQVRDTGMGIDEKYHERLYDEFFQIDNPSLSRAQGVGLGLSIVRRLATLLDCELTLSSTVGRGTVFNVLLPVNDMPVGTVNEAVVSTAKVSSKRSGVSRAVIVEDDSAIADAMSYWASNAGLDVLRFATGEDALQQADVSDADFFLVDFRLAGKMTGVNFLVNRARSTGPVRAAIITGEAIHSVAELSDCPWRVLSKPVSAEELASVLHLPPQSGQPALVGVGGMSPSAGDIADLGGSADILLRFQHLYQNGEGN